MSYNDLYDFDNFKDDINEPRKPRNNYRPSPRRRRNRRRLRNRVIIVTAFLVIFALIIVFISSVFSCICSPGVSSSQLDTATKGDKEVKKVSKADSISFREPNIATNDEAEPGVIDADGELYIWNQTAFELFYGSESRAKSYAKTINNAKKSLGDKIKVYTMVFPNHTEMGLPAEYKNTENGAKTVSQADYIKKIYVNLDDSVSYINAYNELSEHCNEYIYFDSDHHWTALGAYYAYKSFADVTKQKAVKLSSLEEKAIEGFTGSFSTMSQYTLNTDTVKYWTFPYSIVDEVTTENGETESNPTLYYENVGPGTETYGVFLFGDNPLEVITSSCPKAQNKSIAIIHESYGNALVPYFTYNYKKVYSIDFRTWQGDLKSFCEENKIDEVLFANGVMSSATAFQVKAMQNIIQ